MTLISDALQSHVFCGKCGAKTVPIEAGGKRQCTADPAHREYPRTDPVVSPSPLHQCHHHYQKLQALHWNSAMLCPHAAIVD